MNRSTVFPCSRPTARNWFSLRTAMVQNQAIRTCLLQIGLNDKFASAALQGGELAKYVILIQPCVTRVGFAQPRPLTLWNDCEESPTDSWRFDRRTKILKL